MNSYERIKKICEIVKPFCAKKLEIIEEDNIAQNKRSIGRFSPKTKELKLDGRERLVNLYLYESKKRNDEFELFPIMAEKLNNCNFRNKLEIKEITQNKSGWGKGKYCVKAPQNDNNSIKILLAILALYEHELDNDVDTEELFNKWTADNDTKNLSQPSIIEADNIRYWIYSPGEGACMWNIFNADGVMGIGWSEIGNLNNYASKGDMVSAMQKAYAIDKSCSNASLATWQFANEMKPGDIVFAKKGSSRLIGKGIVRSEYYYDDSKYNGYPNLREVEWTHIGEWEHPGKAVTKTLTDITAYKEYVKKLNAIFDDEEVEKEDIPEVKNQKYDKNQFLSEVFMTESKYEQAVAVLKNKKNIIFQGAPGVGKTFAARRLAYSIMGEIDRERVELVQFHQNYSYEDFVMGYKPSGDTFDLRYGIFHKFCKKAMANPKNDYFFIIDEINRGNLSKIFGELLMLIEKDYRGTELVMAYDGQAFQVPENLYIIGMMNTADRSLAMIDYALRRRFSFIEMVPGFESDGFKQYQDGLKNEKFNALIDIVKELNENISSDKSLGKGFCIGHSYFCGAEECTDDWMHQIINYDIIPMLEEYWFDALNKIETWRDRLNRIFE